MEKMGVRTFDDPKATPANLKKWAEEGRMGIVDGDMQLVIEGQILVIV